MNKQMKTKQQMYNRFLHHNMAIAGGFLAGYAVLIHSNFLGNAQTSNLIFFVFSILKRNPLQAVLRFFGVLLYASGGIAFVFVKNKTKYDVRAVSMIITSLMILILGFHIGVVVSYLLVQQFGIKAVWFDWIFIATGIILLINEKKRC